MLIEYHYGYERLEVYLKNAGTHSFIQGQHRLYAAPDW